MAVPIDHVNQIRRKIGELVGIWGDLELLKIEYQKLDLGNVVSYSALKLRSFLLQ